MAKRERAEPSPSHPTLPRCGLAQVAPRRRGRLNGRAGRRWSDLPPAESPRRCVQGTRAHRSRSVPTSMVRSEPSCSPRGPSRVWPTRAPARSAPLRAVDARRCQSRHTPRQRTVLPPRSPRLAIRIGGSPIPPWRREQPNRLPPAAHAPTLSAPCMQPEPHARGACPHPRAHPAPMKAAAEWREGVQQPHARPSTCPSQAGP